MDLRALRYFVYVAEARSFSKAAVQLHVAQPALSRQIRKLEEELGTDLILRTRRQLELTDAGLLLLQRAHSLIRQVAQTADDVRAHGSRVRGAMTLGVSPTICEVLGPAIVHRSAALHPELRLNFVEGFSAFIFKRLIDQELTLCLMHNPPRHQGIEIEPLLTEPMYLIGPGGGSTAHPPAKAGMGLDRLPLILPNRTHSLRMLIERAVTEYGGRFDVAIEVDGYTLTKALIGAGLGYTILPYSSVHQEVADGELSAVRLRKPSLSWTLSLAYRKEQRTARAVTALRDLIAGEVDALVTSGQWSDLAESWCEKQRA
ncbi:MAG TPA: LysR family transcriptional regulator [Xanthobacteraceae bacterium]|jgi:LysR family nitrogen assimilation transcriptional regulator